VSSLFVLPFSQTEQDVSTGDLLSGGGGTPASGALLRMEPTGRVSTIPVGVRAVAVHPDRVSAAGHLITIGNETGVFSVDLANAAITTLTRLGPPAVASVQHVFPPREMGYYRWGSTGVFEIYVRFPYYEASKPFGLWLSLSGVRPGVRLPDGRSIFLNVDALTVATVLGYLGPPLLGPANGGMLDRLGFGRARMDVSGIPGIAGVRLWMVAVVLDKNAPFGMGPIADPMLVML